MFAKQCFLGENWQFTANICPSAVAAHCCYFHKVNEHLHIGAELETSLITRESVGKGCYQLEIPNGNAMFKGEIFLGLSPFVYWLLVRCFCLYVCFFFQCLLFA